MCDWAIFALVGATSKGGESVAHLLQVGDEEVAGMSDAWAFIEAVARPSGSDSVESQLALLASLQSRAQELLASRETSKQNQSNSNHDEHDGTTSGQGGSPRRVEGDGQINSTTTTMSDDKEKLCEEANERVARRMLERTPSSSRGDDEDKSDTLSDCTTLTETSSVYGVQNTWVDFAVLYSLPFVVSENPSSGSSSSRLKPLPPINISLEQSQLNKIFQECQRAIHTMRAVATVDSLRKVLDRGVTVLHFSGHGGRIAGRKSNCLVFEDTKRTGLAHFIDAATLRNILNGDGGGGGSGNGSIPAIAGGGDVGSLDGVGPGSLARADSLELLDDQLLPPPPLSLALRSGARSIGSSSSMGSSYARIGLGGTLKLVFVSSCHSREIGEVFIEAGVQHVVCVRSSDKVLDESSSMFSYAFYHAALAGKTIYQAFEVARARVRADMQLPDNESDKFILLESSHAHSDACPLYTSSSNATDHDAADQDEDSSSNHSSALPHAIEVQFAHSECTCSAPSLHFVFTDLSSGKWMDVSPTNRFSKTLPAIPESFVGREQELHMLAGLVNAQRFVTMRGPPGIGKSTLSIKLAHFLAERHVFPDGVAFIRLRGVQSLEGMETAIKSALFPDGGRDKELPLHQVLNEMKVLLILDNMEDPINANPAAVHEFLLHLLQNTPHLAFLMTARQAMGGGIAGFDEKVVSLNRLSHFHAADLFLRKSPRALVLSEIGEIDPKLSSKLRSASVVEALTCHPLMAFLDGHPQAISLCAPLLQDRSLSELTRAVLSRGVSELQVVGLGANDRSAMNTLVTSLDVSLEQVRQHHGQDAIRFFALLGLLPAGAMPADFKSLWGNKWESLVETLLRFSLIQRNRIPGFILSNTRGLPNQKQHGKEATSTGSSRRTSSRASSSSSSRQSTTYDHALLVALKAYGDFISGGAGAAAARGTATTTTDSIESSERSCSSSTSASSASDGGRNLLNTLTRSGRVARAVDHVEKMDSQAEILAVCVSYSTFPFITSYARSLLGLYDDETLNKNDALESICVADRELFLYNSARHFWKVSFWIFQHICTLAARSSASYLILDVHESNLWMLLDLHIRRMDEWQKAANCDDTATDMAAAAVTSTGAATTGGALLSVDCSQQLAWRERTSSFVVDVACFFAHSLFLAGRHRGAWNAVNKALHIAKYHKDTLSEANTRKLMGILLTTETKFDEAKAQFGLALILYKSAGDKMGQAASLSAIGMIHSRKGNLRGAHNCFTKALTLYEWFKHSLGQLNCHQRLANLEKKLRDGDGLRGRAAAAAAGGGASGVPSAQSGGGGHSHHYAATRRLQGDLNRKRNGEYIVRWVGHEMSLLLELPTAKPDKVKEAHSAAAVSLSSTAGGGDTTKRGATTMAAAASPTGDHQLPSSKPPTPVVANSPKKCRLGQIIDHHERAAASNVNNSSGGAAVSGSSGTSSESLADRLKASSFTRRKEYAASIRRTLSASSSDPPPLSLSSVDAAPTA